MVPQLYKWQGQQAHIGPWRHLAGTAFIAPSPGAHALRRDFIVKACEFLAEEGFEVVVTPALQPNELAPFLNAGFAHKEQLLVLEHDLHNIMPAQLAQDISIRKAHDYDLAQVLGVDELTFDDFWRLDEGSLREATLATPQSRFRVATLNREIEVVPDKIPGDDRAHPQEYVNSGEGAHSKTVSLTPSLDTIPALNLPEIHLGSVVGYCITGRSKHQGFLQRLAVHPASQQLGLGKFFLKEALEWLKRWRVRSCVVNTQESNAKALQLYETCGFKQSASNLHVLSLRLESRD